MASSSSERVPVTVLTGFLGSGKTTLLNHILTATHGKKIAIIENEFGDVGIDDALIQKTSKFSSEEEIIEVLNGCLCCSVRQDLVVLLKGFAERAAAGELKLDAIIIETTGMADPAPVAQTFLIYDEIKAFARLDGIVTMVDAKHVERHLDAVKPEGVVNEAVAQAAFADRLLLNKTDLVTEADLARIEARLRGINGFAPIQRCAHSEVSVESVLHIHGFDLHRALKASPGLLDSREAETKHDASVTSVSLDQGAARHMRTVHKGELDHGLVKGWISRLLKERGGDMYRMKGVLHLAHAEQRFVYHAVHMTFSGSFDEPWGDDEPRESKMVFIGKNLDGEELAASFNRCLATPENMAAKEEALRFAVGEQVECRTGPDKWSRGEVLARNYRDESMPPGMVSPYQVELLDGGLIWTPLDCDSVVRSVRRAARSLPAHEHSHGAVSDQMSDLGLESETVAEGERKTCACCAVGPEQ
mmetsp:Transcript_35671/g.114656  ORF Transcript_35671/g.114656 Transcript_35671/m.114656 type:complete len:474 (+) Transcript_35671:106-1527(+)